MTNADKIRTMADEELAEVVRNPCDTGYYMPKEWCESRNCGYQCSLDWLRQKASKEEEQNISFNLNCWLKETININSLPGVFIFQEIRPRIICNDGFSISVQASEYAYCHPRYTQWQNASGWQVINGEYWLSGATPREFETDHFTPYESVELGYPSEADELIYEYAEDDDYTDTVYGNVPVEVVEKLIEKHGGFKGCAYN